MAKGSFRDKPQDIHANNLQLLKEKIKASDISGCYIFYGNEEYTKNHYSSLLVKEASSNLNVTCFYGSEFNLPDFLSACETSAVESFDMFSMMDDEPEETDNSGYRVIKLYSPDLSSMSPKDTDYFLSFLSDLPEKTIVIFWFYMGEEAAVTKGIYKKMEDFALTVNFRREPVGSSILITWILRHFAKEKINVDRYVAVHLCQLVGNSMTDLKNEIDKLIQYLKYENRDTLEKQDVEYICIKSKDAQIFDISNGALSGDFIKAAKALSVLRDKKEKPIIILGTISKAVSDLCTTDEYIKLGVPIPTIAKENNLHEFSVKNYAAVLRDRSWDFKGSISFAKAVSDLCIEYDKKIKSSRTDGYELLLELIFKISFAGKKSS